MAGEERGVDRAYGEIKRRILLGELRLRERLDLDALARSLKLSITPVRYALTRLSAERLVAAQGARGYFVAMWSERDLRALYEWRGALALLGLQTWAMKRAPPAPVDAPYEAVVHATLSALEADANPELARAATNASDRLLAAWAVEPEYFGDAGEEIERLREAMDGADRQAVSERIRAFFARRADDASAIRKRAAMRALPANGA